MNKIPVLDLTQLEVLTNMIKDDPKNVDEQLKQISRKNIEHYKLATKGFGILKNVELAPTNPYYGYRVLEINPSELCNRTCYFCPRTDPDVYPNRNLHMSLETAQAIADDVNKYDYRGWVAFSGFGEPLLAKNILEMFSMFRDRDVILFTNGDKIPSWYTIDDLIDVGVKNLYVDVYDGVEDYLRWKEYYNEYKDKIAITISPRFIQTYGWQNRAGATVFNKDYVSEYTWCSVPLYKLFINWDGRLNLCCHDWLQKASFDYLKETVRDTPLSEIITSKSFFDMRKDMLYNNRNKHSPCNNCDVNPDDNERYKYFERFPWKNYEEYVNDRSEQNIRRVENR